MKTIILEGKKIRKKMKVTNLVPPREKKRENNWSEKTLKKNRKVFIWLKKLFSNVVKFYDDFMVMISASKN